MNNLQEFINMKDYFHFNICAEVVTYLEPRYNKLTQVSCYHLGFCFDIPKLETDGFLAVSIHTQMELTKKNKLYFESFTINFREKDDLIPLHDSKYHHKISNKKSFINYLIKTSNEKTIPFMEKNIFIENAKIQVQNEEVSVNFTKVQQINIKDSYNEVFNELLNSLTIPNTNNPLKEVTDLLKQYDTKKFFDKMNKNIKEKNLPVKSNKI